MKLNELGLAWCAGFFDGEGWVGAVQATKVSKGIRSYISQKDTRVLERFKAVTSLGRIAGPYRNSCPIYQWRVSSSKDVKRLFYLLRPYLGAIKKKQFRQAIKIWDNRKKISN